MRIRRWPLIFSILVLPTGYVDAGCRTTAIVHAPAATYSAIVNQGYVATQIAIPVGVPVAQYAPYWYSSQQFAAQCSSCQMPADDPNNDNPPLSSRETREPRGLSPADQAQNVFRASCVKCHSGEAAKGHLDLSDVSQLGAESRLKAVGKVLSQEMPKGKKLSAEEVGQVLEVLSSGVQQAVATPVAREADKPPALSVPEVPDTSQGVWGWIKRDGAWSYVRVQ